ncbi:MAG: tRNA 2-thiouridine(34) synthase MnmA [Ruminococcaceae bacterium]|nr:tRNA 2-thiouridine(34) synthase MnmA [Oscillospiraceae bacterium]
MKEKVLLGMSGGLDSAYSCKLLIDSGYEVVGAFGKFHSMSEPEEALRLGKEMGIRVKICDYSSDFEKTVVADLVSSYLNGRTPNPCAMCNKFAKFPSLIKTADSLGIERIATGHYARLERRNGRMAVLVAADKSRDQSYFLWKLGQDVLNRLIFPLAEVIKKDIPSDMRERVTSKESRELCFCEGSYVDFLSSRGIGGREGDFIDKEGKVLGRHSGIYRYTVGQRKGLDIALGRRAYVLDIDPEKNTVMLGFDEDSFCKGFLCDGLNFVSDAPFEGEDRLFVKVRYGAKAVAARVTVENGQCRAVFDEPQKLAAPGQSAVFYREDSLSFGGDIKCLL